MNNEQVKGNWDQFAGKIKQSWGKLTDDDVTLLKGNAQEFFGKLKEKHGIEKEKAEEQLKEFSKSCGDCYTPDSRKAA